MYGNDEGITYSLSEVSQVKFVEGYKVILLESSRFSPTCLVFSQWGEYIGEQVDCENVFEAYRQLILPQVQEFYDKKVSELSRSGFIFDSYFIREDSLCHLELIPKWGVKPLSSTELESLTSCVEDLEQALNTHSGYEGWKVFIRKE